MKYLIKFRGLISAIFILTLLLGMFPIINSNYTQAIDLGFKTDFAEPLLKGGPGGGEKPYNIGISSEEGFVANIKKVFYPDTDDAGKIWGLLKAVGGGLLVVLLVWAGAKFVLDAGDSSKLKEDKMNLLYILLGAAIFFLSARLLGDALGFGSVKGIAGGVGTDTLLYRVEHNIMLVIIGFLKAVAFFTAIVFIVYYGYRMMNSFDREERLNNAKSGILNVIMALVFIKIIDYLYLIAQLKDFKNRAVEFVVQASKLMGWIFGAFLVFVLIYAGFMFVTSSGSDSRIKMATNTVKTALIVVLMVMLFMLIVYQIFQDILVM